jgi:hypothetical protein
MALITIATAPKPFTNPHIAVIQWNAIQSWKLLGPQVDVLLVGDEDGMDAIANELGVPQARDVEKNKSGTPLVSSIFDLMRRYEDSPILLYANADIILFPDIIQSIHAVMGQSENFLGVGRRWDLAIENRLDFSNGWQDRLKEENQTRGVLHSPVGSDFFVFPTAIFTEIPDFAIGRAGWDNWMIFEARRRGWMVVDLTDAATVIHQNHDYSHLPGGQPHYKLPETFENTKMAGGKRMIFTLKDANFRLKGDRVEPIPLRGEKLMREIEIFPLVKMGSNLLGELFFALFHPKKAFNLWRGKIYRFLKRGPKEDRTSA